jgi:putative nucleotidyltransferase with HDIG domain
MHPEQVRRKIAFEAARLLQSQRETEYHHAKWRAARAITRSYISKDSVPTDYEIRQALQQLMDGESPFSRHRDGDSKSNDFEFYASLLAPLAKVTQDRGTHPEGDVLYHSLQVFELAKEARPWDEEFLLAALLHDVGKGIDPRDHVNAGIAVLQERVPERTKWLIENHGTAHRIMDGTIGVRARRRLARSDDREEIELLAECDRQGRMSGRQVGTVEEALNFIQELAHRNEYGDQVE